MIMNESDYERRLATGLEECVKVWNRATDEGRDVDPREVAHIGDILRGVVAVVPWVDVDPSGVKGPPYLES